MKQFTFIGDNSGHLLLLYHNGMLSSLALTTNLLALKCIGRSLYSCIFLALGCIEAHISDVYQLHASICD